MPGKGWLVEWAEMRGGELFFIAGEKTAAAGWQFVERSTFECVWYQVDVANRFRCIERAEGTIAEFSHAVAKAS